MLLPNNRFSGVYSTLNSDIIVSVLLLFCFFLKNWGLHGLNVVIFFLFTRGLLHKFVLHIYF